MTCKHGYIRDETCLMCNGNHEHFGYHVQATPPKFPCWLSIALSVVVGLLLVALVSDEFLSIWNDAPPVFAGRAWSR